METIPLRSKKKLLGREGRRCAKVWWLSAQSLKLPRMRGRLDEGGLLMRVAKFLGWQAIAAAALLCILMLTGCAERELPDAVKAVEPEAVSVSIHSVNHTADPVRFVLTDPQNKNNSGGGETANAFSGGGIMCCYTLPSRWRPGLKIEIAETYWLPQRPDQSIPEVKKRHLLEVPRYAEGKAGELWVTRGPDGAVSIVSTNFEPGHPRYPGVIKGWPVPDLAYHRKLYDIKLRRAERIVSIYINFLEQIEKNPQKRAAEAWEFGEEHNEEWIKAYSGPGDPAFLARIKSDYSTGLIDAKKELEAMKAARP